MGSVVWEEAFQGGRSAVVGSEACWEGVQILGTMDACHPLQVYMKISVPKGIQFVGHPGKRHLTKKTCVASGETEPTWVVLSFGDLGLSNITGEVHVLIGTSPLSRTPRDLGAESSHGGRVSRAEHEVEGQESYWGSYWDQSRGSDQEVGGHIWGKPGS